MTTPKFVNDGTLDTTFLNSALTAQTLELKKDITDLKEQITILNKNIEKIVEILNQTNPRAKNLTIRSYAKSGIASHFIKE